MILLGFYIPSSQLTLIRPLLSDNSTKLKANKTYAFPVYEYGNNLFPQLIASINVEVK